VLAQQESWRRSGNAIRGAAPNRLGEGLVSGEG